MRSRTWPRLLGLAGFMALVCVNLFYFLVGALPSTNAFVADQSDWIGQPQSPVTAGGTGLYPNAGGGEAQSFSQEMLPVALSGIEPAAGDAEAPETPVPDSEDIEYSGDGNASQEPQGLDAGTHRISGMSTFSELNDVVELLRQRRQELVRREDRAKFREQLLSERETAVEAALRRLEALRDEIDAIIAAKSEEEERELQRLVSVYEGMKAKKAAVIFNTLDTGVLIDVANRMRESKFAVILQSMDPKRAEFITEEIAKRAKLPEVVQPSDS